MRIDDITEANYLAGQSELADMRTIDRRSPSPITLTPSYHNQPKQSKQSSKKGSKKKPSRSTLAKKQSMQLIETNPLN